MTRPPVVRSIVRVLIVAVAGLGLLVAYAVYRIGAQGERDEARPADAIVVLGAAQYNGQLSGVFEARLEHAVDLWKSGLAPYLIVTGGKLPADLTTEAAAARAWAIAHGVPEEAILAENRGRNTLESLEGVATIMARQKLRSAVFVSDQTHMLRVLRMASDLGMTAWGSATRTSATDLDPARRWRAVVHELAGLAAYYVGAGHLFEDQAVSTIP